MNKSVLAFGCWAIAVLCAPPVWGQSSPAQTVDAAQLIEQLESRPVTRGLRNLKPVARSVDLVVPFDFNSDRLLASSQDQLKQLAEAMLSPRLLDSKFRVEGHTDAKGSADYNRSLSQRRATSVVKYLAAQGVAVSRLSAVGKGSIELANPNDPFAPENRRVRIVNPGD